MKKLRFPAYIMPKFDGVFAESVFNPETDKVEIISRQLHPFTNVKYHLEELAPVYERYKDILLFGEFYEHGKKLQEISGITRDGSKTNKLTYYIFDCIRTSNLEAPFEERHALLNKVFEKYLKDTKYVKRMETVKVKDEKEMKKVYDKYLKLDYEGAMLYLSDGLYKFYYTASRSNSVFKMKPRKSEEFKIVGFKDGRGKNQGLVSFILETEDGHKFNAEPNMPEDMRRKLFEKFQKKFTWKDKMGTVTYSDLSDKGIPQQPKFIALREEF
jgi:ATP-dependent DNA ligase